MVSGPAISSMSLGRAAVHSLHPKLAQAALKGYKGIEIFYEDLECHAAAFPGGATEANLMVAARQIRALCAGFGLIIISLQPYKNYEGCLDREKHLVMLQELQLWFKLCHLLGTDLLGLPSTITPEGYTGDRKLIVQDLQELSDLGAREQPPIKFGYEALCFGAFVDKWWESWEIVQAVDRPNFGLILDTFNIAGKEWADPASSSGQIENAGAVLRASLDRLKKEVDINKVFLVQLVDAERMRDPIDGPEHAFYIEGSPPRMGWSRNARLFAFEEPGYLPVMDILKVICDEDGLGYKGWVSAELFSRTMGDPRPECPEEHARRGIESWKKVVKVMGWENADGNGVKVTPASWDTVSFDTATPLGVVHS